VKTAATTTTTTTTSSSSSSSSSGGGQQKKIIVIVTQSNHSALNRNINHLYVKKEAVRNKMCLCIEQKDPLENTTLQWRN